MEFNFKVYSNRWGRSDTYSITKTIKGWYVRHIAINGDSDSSGKPFLFGNLNQDSINYPSGLEYMVMYIWQQLDSREISQAQAQTMFDELGEWVSKCEKLTPKWEGWN